jgi:hypothetical protein
MLKCTVPIVVHSHLCVHAGESVWDLCQPAGEYSTMVNKVQ